MTRSLVRPPEAKSSRQHGRSPSPRRSTNLTLSADLVADAQKLAVNLSQAAELGIAAAVKQRQQELWLAENRDAMESSNAYVEAQGLPLAKYRNF
ncbi:type II toxin-antitoxin system CcdA family antitoxin [Paucibacter sp. DJ2R-2]|uniref:type II toxin-antitoxin system CcdA family antitoxin n=1 Tax=Paucibacter sp. DJ2R-2 TaxID=2893558 RepID=UPI0021E35B0A|nr:type II toxin-antitoxin system CcdA family antitoxin [Paucibacter sp. DJ2R-2]MCV2420176.1 type II toxin-antitoxin system CcdA family antitoxin [Paucibacter sp. DJ4R-1]MCV2436879.1 type II toxin-antitoxin system CcdA family antitoxin [Paucibacter sp. DJ2R-2]